MPGIDFALLRQQVSLTQVLDVLGFRPRARHGPQVRGPCPVHGSRSPRSRSFAGHLERHCWRCFDCGAGGNALDLYTAATGLPLYEAALELCRRLGLTPPWKALRSLRERSSRVERVNVTAPPRPP